MKILNEVISSSHNKVVRDTIDIKDNPSDKLFIEGVKLIDEAIKSGNRILYSLILKEYEGTVQAVSPQILESDYYLVTRQILEKVCDTVSPQGIVSIVEYKNTESLIEGNFIVLDNIQDPGNLGSIIRSASGTKFKDICLINGVNPFNQKVIRSTMGRIFDVNFHKFPSTDDFIRFARNNNLSFYSCDMNGDNIFSFKRFENNLGIVIGNEGSGISKHLLNSSKGILSIPMRNNLESLNASVSLGIIAYYLDNL